MRSRYCDRVMIVQVLYHRDEDTWVASSPQLSRWTAVADSYEEAHRLAEEGVRFALDRAEVTIEHFVPAGTAVPA